MKSRFFLLFGCLLFWSISETTAQGAVFDLDAYHQLDKVPEGQRSIRSKKGLKQYCPTPGDQGNVWSCVGFAISHAVTISRALYCGVKTRPDIDKMTHSASYVYNQMKLADSCEAGAEITACLKMVAEKGICLASSFPNSPYKCEALPDAPHFKEAVRYKTAMTERLFDTDAPEEEKVKTTLVYLDLGNPIVVGLPVPDNFRDFETFPKKNWRQVSEMDTIGHAMVIVDYDETAKTFTLLNSYGPTWNGDGFVKISFQDFARLVKVACLARLDWEPQCR